MVPSSRPDAVLRIAYLRIACIRIACIWIASVALLGTGTTSYAADSEAWIASATLRPDGTLAEGLAVVIDDSGRISRVVAVDGAKLPDGTTIRTFPPGSVLFPGLHDLFGRAGAPDERSESLRAIDSEARAATAIDPLRDDLDRARAAGVLRATVSPEPQNPVSGRAVTFATGTRPSLEVLSEDTWVLCVGERALDALRSPTSRGGLRLLLERWLAGDGSFLSASDRSPPVVFCGDALDVRTTLDLFADVRTPILVLGSEAPRSAALLAERGVELAVVGPYTASTPPAERRGAARLAEAGVDVAFRSAFPGAAATSSLESARRAVRAGLDPAAARRALTVTPARIAGLADRHGTIEPGRVADLVVFSGDPLLPGSSVVAVLQGGREIPVAAPQESATAVIPEVEGSP